MRRTPRTGLLLALLFHGGWSVDTGGCETDADCALGEWCDTTAQFCPLGQPGIPDPNVTSLLPPPAWVANSSDTGGGVEGCSWVAEDPSARCRVNGAIPYVGCADPTNIGRPDCNFQVLFAAAPAYSGCCETCGFGTCLTIVPTMKPTSSPKSQSRNQLRAQRWVERVWSVLFFFILFVVLCRYACDFLLRKRQQARERANGPIPVPPPNVNQEAAIARANLSWEVEREQYFTIWGFHLFRNRLQKTKPVVPPVRAPPVPRRPGLFAEQWFRFPPHSWPGGAGCDASPVQIWLGFIRYMWSYKTHIAVWKSKFTARSC